MENTAVITWTILSSPTSYIVFEIIISISVAKCCRYVRTYVYIYNIIKYVCSAKTNMYPCAYTKFNNM